MNTVEMVRSLGTTAKTAANLSVPNVQEQALLGILLGSLYGLARAVQLGYEDRTGRALSLQYSKELRGLLADLEKGNLPSEGQWLAGFYFNSALHRLAALYHRSLKILTGRDDNAPSLLEYAVKAKLLKKEHVSALATVHKEVNKLKHDTFGVLRDRAVDLALTVTAASQAFVLIRVALADQQVDDA